MRIKQEKKTQRSNKPSYGTKQIKKTTTQAYYSHCYHFFLGKLPLQKDQRTEMWKGGGRAKETSESEADKLLEIERQLLKRQILSLTQKLSTSNTDA